jgi:hypothetical protein
MLFAEGYQQWTKAGKSRGRRLSEKEETGVSYVGYTYKIIQGVPLATGPGISLIILPLMRILQRNLKRTYLTFLFISHTTNVLLFKFRYNIFTGVRIIKEMPGSAASGTHCTTLALYSIRMSCIINTASAYSHDLSNDFTF